MSRLSKVSFHRLISTLKKTGGNRTHAAKKLGVSVEVVRHRIKSARESGFVVPAAVNEKAKPEQPNQITKTELNRSVAAKIEVDPERLEAVSPFLERIGLMLALGNGEGAREITDEAEAFLDVMGTETSTQSFFDVPLGEIGFDTRTLNALEDFHQATKIGHLASLPIGAVFSIPNVGEKTVNEMWRVILKYAANRIDGRV